MIRLRAIAFLLLSASVAVGSILVSARLRALWGEKALAGIKVVTGDYIAVLVRPKKLLETLKSRQTWEEVSVTSGAGGRSLLFLAKWRDEIHFFEFSAAGKLKVVESPEAEWFPILENLRKRGFINPLWSVHPVSPSVIELGIPIGKRVPLKANLKWEVFRRYEQGRWPIELVGKTILGNPGSEEVIAIDHELVISDVVMTEFWICQKDGDCLSIRRPVRPSRHLSESYFLFAGRLGKTEKFLIWAVPSPDGGISVLRVSRDALSAEGLRQSERGHWLVLGGSRLYSRVSDIEPSNGRYLLASDFHTNHFVVNVYTGEAKLLARGEGTPLFVSPSLDLALATAVKASRK